MMVLRLLFDKFKADDGTKHIHSVLCSEKLPYYYKDSRFTILPVYFIRDGFVFMICKTGLHDLPQKVIVADYHEFRRAVSTRISEVNTERAFY
jgi:hypothetical protein